MNIAISRRTIRLYIGGSPCTNWSIAQKSAKRETTASGIGWELFLNYVIGLEKYQPDYFLYENNKSMSKAIRDSIDAEFLKLYAKQGYVVTDTAQDRHNKRVELWNPRTNERAQLTRILINSALVSAQNRERYYWTNIPNVEQPEDRKIFLKDVLETGFVWQEKAYCLTATYSKGSSLPQSIEKHRRSLVAEPAKIGTISALNPDGQANRAYSPDGKAVALKASTGGSGARTGLYATPVCIASRGRYADTGRRGKKSSAPTVQHYEAREDGKTNALTTVQKDNMVSEPVIFQTAHGYNVGGIKYGKSPTLTANGKWQHNNFVLQVSDGSQYPIYEVVNSEIKVNGKSYPIKLLDGFYLIRMLTVTECMRLQTVPEDYVFPVSNTQAYKMLGNGWTVDVIAHILSHIPDLQDVEVLSMYDGMSCGHIALDKLGANVTAYYATEIDDCAIETTMYNYPDTVQLGDARQVRVRPFSSAYLSSFLCKQCSLFAT